jgi:hypothetical protein
VRYARNKRQIDHGRQPVLKWEGNASPAWASTSRLDVKIRRGDLLLVIFSQPSTNDPQLPFPQLTSIGLRTPIPG